MCSSYIESVSDPDKSDAENRSSHPPVDQSDRREDPQTKEILDITKYRDASAHSAGDSFVNRK